MSDPTFLFVGAAEPEAREREPRHGTRLFAVLAASWAEAEGLIRERIGRPDAPVAERADAPTRLYAGRLPLEPGRPVEFSLERRG
ncbi:hypothetical protein D3218_04710 [Aureimonas flava]|uniref:Uncharacterized protein n=1 Tax=Aureimonas flava TaxID=2320271 RepID=A0A3A1WPJ8_9HYPH|nr:hypothetical protein [Aureimonas flava]RIY02665.1 hypothetical protein D3218_04710 [Aureimonas flava]